MSYLEKNVEGLSSYISKNKSILKHLANYYQCKFYFSFTSNENRTIKFWTKTDMNWSCQQTIQTNFMVCSLSLNKSQTKLILCGNYSQEILVMELNSAQWNNVRQLCFISDSKFLSQGFQECLEIYNYQQNERQFIKETTLQVQKEQSYGNYGCPFKYLEFKGFVIIQCGNYLNFLRVDENQNCDLSYFIDFKKENWFFGNISDDDINQDSKSILFNIIYIGLLNCKVVN